MKPNHKIRIGGIKFLILTEHNLTIDPKDGKRWTLQRIFDGARFTYTGKKLPRNYGELKSIEKPHAADTEPLSDAKKLEHFQMWGVL